MSKDPTEPLRLAASAYPEVDRGTACTQSSFKARGKSFFFTGPQGGRFKAMFKLGPSLEKARTLASKEPDRFDVGSTAWVTARFTAEKPMPKRLWRAWLDESYALATASTKRKKTTKKKAAKKRTSPKKTTAKKATKKKAKASRAKASATKRAPKKASRAKRRS